MTGTKKTCIDMASNSRLACKRIGKIGTYAIPYTHIPKSANVEKFAEKSERKGSAKLKVKTMSVI